MSWNCTFRREFFEDALRARDWYELEQTGLGFRFVDCLNAVVDSVALSPELFSFVDRATRVAVIVSLSSPGISLTSSVAIR